MGTPPPSERGITRRHLLAGGGVILWPFAAAACETKSSPSGLNVQKTVEAAVRATTTALASKPKDPPTPIPIQPTQRPPTPVPTAAPLPAPTVVRQVTAAPTEQPRGQEFTRYRSVNYPYQIDYPSSWSVQSTNVGGRKVDIYLGKTNQVSMGGTRTPFQNNINIFTEPITGQPRLEDYKTLVASQTKQALNPYSFSEQFLPKALDGNDVWVIQADKLVGHTIRVMSAITIKKGQGWQITFTEALGTNLASEDSNLFSKVMGSFKFL